MSKAKQKPPIQFRPTDDLEGYLRAKAKEAFRSINQEILFRLELSRRADEQCEAKASQQ